MHEDDDPRLALARQPGPAGPRVAALRAVARERLDTGDSGSAVELYEEAVELARSDPSTLLPHTLRHLGDLLRETGRLDAADSVYAEAMALYRSHPGTAQGDLANAIRSLALMQEALGRIEEATAAWSEARELYERLAVGPGVEESDAALARLRTI